ncbi:hypothetical protein [Swingsia samuiensis]|uniref:DUF2184 domain-containing protein n=1 Tax=Swingsia samuiensis TaxID=1293412 RepID=A0A4Y6UN01_9PROT|nr:hypothetical protein [Swingsia samuiensis]QDH17415.1 hypothetical protein E3D00_07430 [Swingsia samuiensis]
MSTFRKDAPRLAMDYGIHLGGVSHYGHEKGAFDSAPTFPSVTAPNSGIPSVFTTAVDPQVIRALITPTRSEQVYGSAKAGDRTQRNRMFPLSEYSGYTASYGDYSDAGRASANANWTNRQNYLFQTWAQYGNLESEMMGAAGFSWVNEQRMAAISVLNKTSNSINLWGLSGLELYGALNDPALPRAIQPTPKAGTASGKWTETGDPNLIYNDFVALRFDLNKRLQGNMDQSTPVKVVLPSELSPVLSYTNQFGITLEDMLKKGFPTMSIEFLPEAGTSMSGGQQSANLVQMFVPTLDGVDTVTTAFVDKLVAHRVEQYSTYERQKMSAGSWGTIWRRPTAVAQMVGV